MKTEIPELRKVQYYYTDLLFLLAEGHKPNIFLLNIYLFSNCILSAKYLELFS